MSIIIPHHIDIIQLTHKTEQNLITNQINPVFPIDRYTEVNVRLNETNLSNLKSVEYLATFNTGKTDFWLFLTNRYNRQTAILILKSERRKMWVIPSHFPDEYYSNTLLDVSIFKVSNRFNPDSMIFLQDGEHFLVLINDLFILKNKRVFDNSTLQVRQKHLTEMFRHYHYQDFQSFEYGYKPYVSYPYLNSFWFDYHQTLNYQKYITGLVFRPNSRSDQPNYYYFISKNLKKKIIQPVDPENIPKTGTVELTIEATGTADLYHLYSGQKSVGIALVNDLETSRMLQKELRKGERADYLCKYDENFQTWKPLTKLGS